jgi:hypothetical protein
MVHRLIAGQQRDTPADVGAVHRPATAIEDERSPDGDQDPVAVLQGFTGGLAPAKVAGEPLILTVLDTAV